MRLTFLSLALATVGVSGLAIPANKKIDARGGQYDRIYCLDYCSPFADFDPWTYAGCLNACIKLGTAGDEIDLSDATKDAKN